MMTASPTPPAVTPDTAQQLGLLPEEFEAICQRLGRTPNFTELSIFSVMWSEHCSYKHSRAQLKRLPTHGPHVLAAAGDENAGLLDIGDGLAVAFKIESHNHPSAIEPFQGAATGVGGIHRDIFTLGARPVAALNSLRFGDPTHADTKRLLQGVVRGISHYGNCFGVPTVGGEIYFDKSYNTNPLVNAMSVGVLRREETIRSSAEGPGNPVFIVGSATGKDGIHGASFASADMNAESAENLPSVQVGDPFQEKLLLEACLEAAATGAIVGMQDMGAAGITSSTTEMAAKGGVGLDIHLDRVHTRQDGMQPFEILLSESQERMLIVAQQGREEEIRRVFAHWDLPCEHIGEVTEGNRLRYFWHGEVVADLQAEHATDSPEYDLPTEPPDYYGHILGFDERDFMEPMSFSACLEFLLQVPDLASKRPVTEHYDSTVGAATMTSHCYSDAAVVHLHGTNKALAMTTDCNARWVYLNPGEGTKMAVAEAARNLVCTGAQPIGVSNCLNFGNPYKRDVYYQFTEAVNGLGNACRAFNLPVTGGNVSFYNQFQDGTAVFPTPTIGMVGLLAPAELGPLTYDFKQPGDQIFMLGEPMFDLDGSSYLYFWHECLYSGAPYVNLQSEHKLHDLMLELHRKQILQSAHDISDGGLALAVCESAFPNRLGFKIESFGTLRLDAFLFSEAGGRVIISVRNEEEDALRGTVIDHDVPLQYLGQVTEDGTCSVDRKLLGKVSHLAELHESALKPLMGED